MNAATAAIRTSIAMSGNGPRSLRGGGGAIFGAAVAVAAAITNQRLVGDLGSAIAAHHGWFRGVRDQGSGIRDQAAQGRGIRAETAVCSNAIAIIRTVTSTQGRHPAPAIPAACFPPRSLRRRRPRLATFCGGRGCLDGDQALLFVVSLVFLSMFADNCRRSTWADAVPGGLSGWPTPPERSWAFDSTRAQRR